MGPSRVVTVALLARVVTVDLLAKAAMVVHLVRVAVEAAEVARAVAVVVAEGLPRVVEPCVDGASSRGKSSTSGPGRTTSTRRKVRRDVQNLLV